MYIQALKLLWPAIKENKKYAILVGLGTLSLIGMSVAFNKWRQYFYDKIQAYDTHSIYIGLLAFTILALVFVFIYGLTSFWTRYLEFGCRQYLYNKYAEVGNEIHQLGILNVEQRIQDDTNRFSRTAIALLKALLDSTVRLPVFLFILASTAKLWMVGVVLLYATIGTILSRRVASKLVSVEYVQESREATLRKDILQAFSTKSTLPDLKSIMENWKELALRNKYLSYYTSFYSQISVIFPFIMLIPLYLDKSIMLGTLFATSSAIEQVLGSLSVFVESRDLIIDLNMTCRRLKEMED